MKSLIAFIKKEFTEQFRSGKLIVLGLIFVLIGIMNPAIAKLTPWILKMVAESSQGSGISVGDVKVTALDSWLQFYKNIPLGLIAFVLMESSIFTKEYSSGTLVLSLTKGPKRYKVVVSKAIVLESLWTICYWMCFEITYGYNTYFWDNSVAKNLIFSAVCWWLFGVMVIVLMVLFSVSFQANTGVLLGTGGVVFASYLAGMLPKCGEYLPTRLMDGTSLIYGAAEAKSYVTALVIGIAAGVLCFAISIPIFNRKHL